MNSHNSGCGGSGLTRADLAAIAAWRYPGRYSTCDFDDPSVLATDHWAVTEAGDLLGYCCFGAPARVPGAKPEPDTAKTRVAQTSAESECRSPMKGSLLML